jgi:FtsP/CotA-like multicopper oxidase with cupredoxin domain
VDRRRFLAISGATGLSLAANEIFPDIARAIVPPGKADFSLRIAPVSLELAPGRIVRTIGYNGTVPGPLLRMREGKQVTVDVFNETSVAELVHWHGQVVPSDVDGASEEGTPAVPAHGHRRYTFTPRPAGARWYHTHAFAGRNLHRGLYTGQFGFLYVDPPNDPGKYDREVFLALHEWEPFYTNEEDEDEAGCIRPDGDEGREGAHAEMASYRTAPAAKSGDLATLKANGLEVGYKQFSINGPALGHGEPIRVKQGDRVLIHLLNASATESRRMALAGHTFIVVALDGNPVPTQATVSSLEIGPAERVDAIVEMNRPGVWILGTTNDDDRNGGMGIVVEYAGRNGPPQWTPPPKTSWDYTIFGVQQSIPAPDRTFHLTFRKISGGEGSFNRWTINGKSFPRTDPLVVDQGRRYRLIFDNQSDDPHPVHLHRHTFELTKVAGKTTSGVRKDTVMVKQNHPVEVDFIADNPGLTLFHCHQQLHMDFGFMTLLRYSGGAASHRVAS